MVAHPERQVLSTILVYCDNKMMTQSDSRPGQWFWHFIDQLISSIKKRRRAKAAALEIDAPLKRMAERPLNKPFVSTAKNKK